MLLGIAYHAALSFSLGAGWIVQDISQSKALYIFQAFVHGFRMQLFMVLSGFFTALLWRRQGLNAMLRHRFKRVLLPCLAALVTLVPAVQWTGAFAAKANTARRLSAPLNNPPGEDLWNAIKTGNLTDFEEYLKRPGALTVLHPEFHLSVLSWAALAGTRETVAALLEKGADPNWRSAKGHTALHGAAFLGRYEVAELLVCGGADIHALSHDGQMPWQRTLGGYEPVERFAEFLGIPVRKEQVLDGRRRILERLEQPGAERHTALSGRPAKSFESLLTRLVHTPVFSLVWFLWFLVWLIPLFSIYAAAAERFGWKLGPHPFVVTQRSLFWLVPFTAVPTCFMKSAQGEFGPDTSMGILPMPHVLAYYALFFGFGVLYSECNDAKGRLGGAWRWTFPVTMLVVLPVALECATGAFGLRDRLVPAACHRMASVVFQSLYAWMMSFACMGMFRSLLASENHRIRYLSEAAYWFYLAHLPLVITLQALVCQWPLPAGVKFLTVCFCVGLVLLWTYQKLVRYSLLGCFLNGPRSRPGA
jgi:hypothetical protein